MTPPAPPSHPATREEIVTLNGITWNHSRALPPLVAVAQRYEELHPDVRIVWQKRTLHEFGHMPVDQLARNFDLVVIDHPFAGAAFAKNLFHDLFEIAPKPAIDELGGHCIGPSFESYVYRKKLLAIPIDAATPCPFWRADLLGDVPPPRTWQDLTKLAGQKKLIMPGFAPDLFLNWLMLVHAVGGEAFASVDRITETSTAIQAIELLAGLCRTMPEEIAEWNPIRVHELLASDQTGGFAYCPFAYTYNNYARPGFAAHAPQFGNLITLDGGKPLRSIIGGTGIAISHSCRHVAAAVDFALVCASAAVQRGIYVSAGGQPARVEAWQDPLANAITGNFFEYTRETQSHALVRPRYDGYVPLQESAGRPLQACCIRREISAERTVEIMNDEYRRSLDGATSPPEL